MRVQTMAQWFNITNSVRLLILLQLLLLRGFSQTSVKSEGDNNQNVGVNNGLVIQQNIKLSEPTREQLRTAAKSASMSDQGLLPILTPGQAKEAETTCNVLTQKFIPEAAKHTLMVELGQTSYLCLSDKCTIIADRTSGELIPLLTVRRTERSLVINAVVYGPSGEVLAKIDDNQPHVNKNFLFGWARPDEHTLILTDSHNEVPLDIKFLNPNTVRVKGTFFGKNRFGVKISDSSEAQLSGTTVVREAPLPSACLPIAETQVGYYIEQISPSPSIQQFVTPEPFVQTPPKTALLYNNIAKLTERIRSIQTDFQSSATRVTQEFYAPYKYGKPGPIPKTLTDQYLQQLVLADQGASNNFAALQTQLIANRQSAIDCIQFTPRQKEDDDKVFTRANAKALRPTSVELLEKNQPDTLKFGEIISYFNELHTKLADYKCGMY
jgi:hypothetical protein